MWFRVVESVSDHGSHNPLHGQSKSNTEQQFEDTDVAGTGIEHLEPSDFNRVRLINDDRLRRATASSLFSTLWIEHSYSASSVILERWARERRYSHIPLAERYVQMSS